MSIEDRIIVKFSPEPTKEPPKFKKGDFVRAISPDMGFSGIGRVDISFGSLLDGDWTNAVYAFKDGKIGLFYCKNDDIEIVTDEKLIIAELGRILDYYMRLRN